MHTSDANYCVGNIGSAEANGRSCSNGVHSTQKNGNAFETDDHNPGAFDTFVENFEDNVENCLRKGSCLLILLLYENMIGREVIFKKCHS